MKFGLFYQLQLPKPLDSDDWEPGQEAELFRNCLEEIELADKVGFDHVWLAEHHFTGEYNHLSAPAVMLGAIAARTKNIRVGHSIVQMMPANNHPVKVAENIATIDLISNGRVDFGVGIGGATEQDAFWPELIELAKAGGMKGEAPAKLPRATRWLAPAERGLIGFLDALVQVPATKAA